MAIEVKIAAFKSKLSAHLRSVRRGNELVIKDRDTPIARLVPYRNRRPRLQVRPATRSVDDLEKWLKSRPRLNLKITQTRR